MRTRAILIFGLLGGCYRGVSGTGDGGEEAGSAEEGGSEGASEGGSEGGDGASSPFQCDPEAIPPELALRRLSRIQYENTLRDLVAWAVPDAVDDVLVAIDAPLGGLPEDAIETIPGEVHGGYRRLDQSVHQAHIDASFHVATTIAEELVATPERRAALVGACADDGDASNDDACLGDFIARFGERALRRPLDPDEIAFYRDVFDGDGSSVGMDPEGFADVVTVMLTAPQFLYMVEHGDAAVEGRDGSYWLSSFELASRLSYHFWQTMPDDALFEAAKSGALLDDDEYAAQVDRLLADPRAAETFGHYYREWLWLDSLPAMDALLGTPAFDTVRGDFEPLPDTTTNMIAEVVDMARWYTFTAAGSFDELLQSDRSFARTDDLAQIYGMPAWDGNGDPPTFSDDARAGLLTRAALVATGGLSTRPIKKGVFIRKGLLCDVIPPPPNNAAANPPEVSDEMTTREVVEELTEMPGSACAACHATMINPLGFATENFDPLGRVRAEQVLFDDAGQVVGSKPIDTTSVPGISGADEVSSGAADLTRMMIDSGKPQACFARNLVRFTWARPEDLERDGCVLDDAATRLATGESLADVLHAIAMQPQFRQRSFE